MLLRVKQARLSDLNDAVWHTVELGVYNRAERKKIESKGNLCSANTCFTETRSEAQNDISIDKLSHTLKQIQKGLTSLKASRPGYKIYVL